MQVLQRFPRNSVTVHYLRRILIVRSTSALRKKCTVTELHLTRW